ncbi:MAG TPA: response regulator [Phycisphaerae bacterium]|nr:response regulator [Phycisphaerae bacterium]
MANLQAIRIMLVEDDPGDQKLIRQSILRQKLANDVCVMENGEEALEYLNACKAGDPNCAVPELILLDLNMPGMGGKEFLKRLKSDENLDTIPVVILTTSDSDQDILDTYKLHASGYIKKPVELKAFQEVMSTLEDYWFMICKRVASPEVHCTA